jgi:hypothetical protein
VASIIGTSDARPERRSPPTRGAWAGVHATTPPTSRRARPSQHLTSSSPSSTRRDEVPNDISVRQLPQRLDNARGLSISRKMQVQRPDRLSGRHRLAGFGEQSHLSACTQSTRALRIALSQTSRVHSGFRHVDGLSLRSSNFIQGVPDGRLPKQPWKSPKHASVPTDVSVVRLQRPSSSAAGPASTFNVFRARMYLSLGKAA